MSSLRKAVFLTLVVALLVSSPAVAFAQGGGNQEGPVFVPFVSAPQSSGAAVVTLQISAAEQAAALSMMTRDEIAEADALDIMVDQGPAEVDIAALAGPEVLGVASSRAPGRAAVDADQVARAAYAADWAPSFAVEDEAELEAGLEAEAANLPEGTSQRYTSYIANWLSSDQRIYPHRWIGRLSFSTPSGTSYCSATSISGNNIVTAAHCLYDTPSRNQWYSNWVFTPAYRNGNAPYGSFAATVCTILTAWVNLGGGYSINTWAPYDVGVCTVGRNSANQTLNSAVGFAGRMWNYDYLRHIFNAGYPFRNYNNSTLSWAGAYLRLCSAETFFQATNVRGMGCSWGGGISGGPWIDQTGLASSTAYGTNGYWPGRVSGYVDGVNSGIFIGTQNIYGARFNSNNIVLICNARGC